MQKYAIIDAAEPYKTQLSFYEKKFGVPTYIFYLFGPKCNAL